MKKFLTFFVMLCALLGFSVPVTADTYYIRGGDDWTNGTELKQEGSTTVYSCMMAMPANAQFKIYNSTLNKWWGYGDNNDAWTINSFPATNQIWCDTNSDSGGTVKIVPAGTYKFSFNTTGNNLTVSKVEEYPTLYFVGSQNSWSKDDTYKFNRNGNVYTLNIAEGIYDPDGTEDESKGWKIYNGSWGDYVFGAPNGATGADATPQNGVSYNLTKGTSSANLRTVTGGKAATITMTYSATGTSTVKVDWALKPTAPTISVSTNNMVTITKSGNGTIYYTLDGSDPQSSPTAIEYSGPFKLAAASTTVWARVKDGEEWSDDTKDTLIYGMPVPTIIIENGVVTISVSPLVDGAKLMYGVDDDSCGDEYSGPFPVSEGQTVYAQYVSTVFGSSDKASKKYTAVTTTVTLKTLSGTTVSTLTSTDGGKTFTGSGTLPAAGNDDASKLRFEVSDGSSAWYAIVTDAGKTNNNWIESGSYTQTNSGLTVQKTTDVSRYFCQNDTENGTASYRLTVKLNDAGDVTEISIIKIGKQNNLTFGDSMPQIVGGLAKGNWNDWVDFDKVSDTQYTYTFTASGSSSYFIIKINDKNYKPANGNMALSGGEASTYIFTEVTEFHGGTQCNIDGLNNGDKYLMTLEETPEGMQLSVAETSVNAPTYNRQTESNVVTVNIPAGCTLHYRVDGGEELTAATSPQTFTIPADGMKVEAWLTKTIGGKEVSSDHVTWNLTYYAKSLEWPTTVWSLSNAMKDGEVKYFYLSDYQNDNRVSPEWEMIKNGDTYTLKNFMVIPAASFVVRRIAKDTNGKLTYSDYGHGSYDDMRPEDFGVSAGSTAEAKEYSINSQTLTKNPAAGYTWDIGYSMVTVTVTDATGSSVDAPANVTATLTVDFSQPSTAQCAPIPGMPYVALTGSQLEVPTIGGQAAVKHAVTLDSDHPEYQDAFTNAWIQYDKDSKMYVYGAESTGDFKDVSDDAKGSIYHRSSFHKAAPGAVMSSTIMPPRYPIWFKLTDSEGNVSNVTSNKTILKYKGQETRQFTAPNDEKTKEDVKFAVYALNDMEMAGLFKVYSGYGARDYGTTTNGLSLFNNWGVGHQPSNDPYGHSTVASGVSYPLSGGGPRTDDKGYAKRDGGSNVGTGVDDTKEDNHAGRYFGFDTRTYVSELNFYYALERDNIGNLDSPAAGVDETQDYNTHQTDANTKDIDTYTNNGRNYSWYRFSFEGSFGQITLDKEGADQGRVTWSINKGGNGHDDIVKYKVVFYQVDPETGEPIGESIVIKEVTECPAGTLIIPEATDLRKDLKPGWYEAKLYYTVKENESGDIVERIATSTRILIFNLKKVSVNAEQRITYVDEVGNEVGIDEGMAVYHPVIDVNPDVASALADLEASLAADISTELTLETAASARIEIAGLRDVSVLTDADGNNLSTSASGSAMYATYDANNGKATVHYPLGFFTSSASIPAMGFAVKHAVVGKETTFVLTLHAEGSTGEDSTDDDKITVYMPAGKLYGKLEPQAVHSDVNGEVEFNALAVTNQDDLPTTEVKDGYARIRYVDTNGNLCYIGTMGGTSVMAEIKYIGNDGTEKVLFGDEKLDMRLDPDDDNAVYTAKRLKIAGIPYETETAIDAAGETINVRKDQSAKFSVQLTYSIEGNDPYTTEVNETTLTYNAEELTSPRKGLADIKADTDVLGETERDGKTVATDVTALTESFVENYGGLITNIEDAHVALQAVPKHEKLIGYDSFDKWYMDHGDKYEDETPNPHSPAHRRAIGHTDLAGTTEFKNPDEVHPLLRPTLADGTTPNPGVVTEASDFQKTSTVNNAWWNSAATIAPAFHNNDHIKGDFVRDDKGNITSWKSESKFQKPADHRAYWAGVMAGNDEAYKRMWNNGIIDRGNGVSVDIRDPKHGYYDMVSHFASVTEDGVEKPVRSAYYLGEIPLNANDLVAFFGDAGVDKNGNIVNPDAFDPKGNATHLGDFNALRTVAMALHDNMSEKIATAKFTNCKATVTIEGVDYKLDYPENEPWNFGNTWKTRADLAFKTSNLADLEGMSPAEAIFAAADNHMIFKVNHVNHESWFVPNGIPQGSPKTYSLWEAFKGTTFGSTAFNDLTTDKQKDDYIMSVIRMELDDYCPLAYDVRYTYPFLTTEHVTAENYNNAKTRAAATEDFNRINNMLAAVKPGEVTPVAARDTGRVPFFSNMTTSPEEVVPTAISDVRDDIRGNGFSIVYNRAAGTVTVTAEGDRQLKDAAVYDATGASLVMGTSADRISDQIIVLDVRNIARGAYVVSTNLGGAKFMK